MITFKTDRPNNRNYILKKLAFSLLFFSVILFCLILFNLNNLIDTFSICAGALLLKEFIDLATERRIREISFDGRARQVEIKYKTFYGEMEEKQLPFDDSFLELAPGRSKALKSPNNLKLYFHGPAKNSFEISKDKDGLSGETLRRIFWTAEIIPLTIK